MKHPKIGTRAKIVLVDGQEVFGKITTGPWTERGFAWFLANRDDSPMFLPLDRISLLPSPSDLEPHS